MGSNGFLCIPTPVFYATENVALELFHAIDSPSSHPTPRDIHSFANEYDFYVDARSAFDFSNAEQRSFRGRASEDDLASYRRTLTPFSSCRGILQ